MSNKDKILAVLETLENYMTVNKLRAGGFPITEWEVCIPCVDEHGDDYECSLMRDVNFGELYDWLGKATVQ